MKKNTLLLLALMLLTLPAWSQPKKPTRTVKSWHIDEQFAIADTVPIDTARLNFQDRNIIDRLSIANSYNGNYGSPIQSMIYTHRMPKTDFLFETPYKPYLMDVPAALFYDATFPYTNLTYLAGGPLSNREEQVKFLFTAGPSKNLNFGTNLDFIYAKGRYANQAAQRFAGNLFGRFNTKHYTAYALIALNTHLNHENGGLANISLLTNPDVDVKHKDMPTRMQGYSALRKNTYFYNHSYTIGIHREVKVTPDSTTQQYIPVTRFGHAIKYEEMKKRYFEPRLERPFYTQTYDTIHNTNDTAAVRTLTNLLSISLAEEFNTWMRFGATGYIENEVQQFTQFKDSTLQRVPQSSTRIGGMLSKTQGVNIRYTLLGDIYLIGYKLGEFRLQAQATGNFSLRDEPVILTANASVRNEQPSFFLQNYYSNHFRWENTFTKTYKTHLGGTLTLPKRNTHFRLTVENITNQIYFNADALPTQHSGNVQVLVADWKQDIHFGKFALENNAVYQVSSNQAVLPLPTLTLFHNLYYHDKWFLDLYPQLGVSVRYHTQFMAPAYMPATGQFYNQQTTPIGNYPMLNAYANFHLKTARFFFKYDNIGALFLKKQWGFLMPNYPVNPPMFKVGLSWNFYN